MLSCKMYCYIHVFIVIAMTNESTEQEMISMETIAAYQVALKDGSQPSNQFKLVALGAEGGGKTCTIDTLFNKPFQRVNRVPLELL